VPNYNAPSSIQAAGGLLGFLVGYSEVWLGFGRIVALYHQMH
jgi:hypothetical protein